MAAQEEHQIATVPAATQEAEGQSSNAIAEPVNAAAPDLATNASAHDKAASTVTRAESAPQHPTLSIIVPVYNVEDYLDACLDSLQAQTFMDIEMVCVNDGSPDGSRDILARRQSQDPRIVIVDKPNGGLSSARNAGINAARGTYIGFLDADDRFTANACQRITETFAKTDADVVTFGGYCNPAEAATPWITLKLSPRDVVYDGFSPDLMFKEQSTPYIRTACRKAFLDENGIRFEEALPFGEDQVFFFDIYPNSRKTALISDKLYEYRIEREGSLTSKTNDDLEAKSRKHLPMTRRIFSAWKKRFGPEEYSSEIVSWSIEFVLYGLLCLPEPVRNELLPKYAQIFREFWGNGGSIDGLQLRKHDRKLLETALSDKPVSNTQALHLRAGWFLEKYGAKAVVGKALGMN
jgi:glycosyltransferase involved in cell wall biosynthesis